MIASSFLPTALPKTIYFTPQHCLLFSFPEHKPYQRSPQICMTFTHHLPSLPIPSFPNNKTRKIWLNCSFVYALLWPATPLYLTTLAAITETSPLSVSFILCIYQNHLQHLKCHCTALHQLQRIRGETSGSSVNKSHEIQHPAVCRWQQDHFLHFLQFLLTPKEASLYCDPVQSKVKQEWTGSYLDGRLCKEYRHAAGCWFGNKVGGTLPSVPVQNWSLALWDAVLLDVCILDKIKKWQLLVITKDSMVLFRTARAALQSEFQMR